MMYKSRNVVAGKLEECRSDSDLRRSIDIAIKKVPSMRRVYSQKKQYCYVLLFLAGFMRLASWWGFGDSELGYGGSRLILLVGLFRDAHAADV